jgi:hypothetical protein
MRIAAARPHPAYNVCDLESCCRLSWARNFQTAPHGPCSVRFVFPAYVCGSRLPVARGGSHSRKGSMGIFDSLFGSKSRETSSTSAQAPADWYCVESRDRSVQQVVLSFAPDSATDSPFGILILPADKYPVLTAASWTAGFATINGESVGMFRASDFAPQVKAAGVTMAITFGHMPSHAVLLVSIRVDSPALCAAVRRKHPNVPAIACPVAEWISGLSAFDRELVSAVFASPTFRLVLSDDTGGSSRALQPNGTWREGFMPRVVCEFHKPIGADLKKAFDERWRALLAHADKIPSYKRNFQAAIGSEIVSVLPLDKDPVLPRQR